MTVLNPFGSHSITPLNPAPSTGSISAAGGMSFGGRLVTPLNPAPAGMSIGAAGSVSTAGGASFRDFPFTTPLNPTSPVRPIISQRRGSYDASAVPPSNQVSVSEYAVKRSKVEVDTLKLASLEITSLNSNTVSQVQPTLSNKDQFDSILKAIASTSDLAGKEKLFEQALKMCEKDKSHFDSFISFVKEQLKTQKTVKSEVLIQLFEQLINLYKIAYKDDPIRLNGYIARCNIEIGRIYFKQKKMFEAELRFYDAFYLLIDNKIALSEVELDIIMNIQKERIFSCLDSHPFYGLLQSKKLEDELNTHFIPTTPNLIKLSHDIKELIEKKDGKW